MRQFCFAAAATLLLSATPLLAADVAVASLDFTTKLGEPVAWDLRWTGTTWRLSFVDGAVVVDSSEPSDSMLQGDIVELPSMDLADIRDEGDYLTATLTPRGRLEIISESGDSTVMLADVQVGGMLSIGTNYVAYSNVADDLDITYFDEEHGQVIPSFASAEARGLMLDMSFSGDAGGSVNLHDLILCKSGKAQGTLSGQISAIPEPGTILLLGLGTGLLWRLRTKRARAANVS
jgi:hypothetical protein